MTYFYSVLFSVGDYYQTYAVLILTPRQVQIHSKCNRTPLFSALLQHCEVSLQKSSMLLNNYAHECAVQSTCTYALYEALKNNALPPRQKLQFDCGLRTFEMQVEELDLVLTGSSGYYQRLPLKAVSARTAGNVFYLQYKGQERALRFADDGEAQDAADIVETAQSLQEFIVQLDLSQIQTRKTEFFRTRRMQATQQTVSSYGGVQSKLLPDTLTTAADIRDMRLKGEEFADSDAQSKPVAPQHPFNLPFVRMMQEDQQDVLGMTRSKARFPGAQIAENSAYPMQPAIPPKKAPCQAETATFEGPEAQSFDPGTLFQTGASAYQQPQPLALSANQQGEMQVDGSQQANDVYQRAFARQIDTSAFYKSAQAAYTAQTFQSIPQRSDAAAQIDQFVAGRPAQCSAAFSRAEKVPKPSCGTDGAKDLADSWKQRAYDYNLYKALNVLDGQFIALLGRQTVFLSFRLAGSHLFVQVGYKCALRRVIQLLQIQELRRNAQYVQFALHDRTAQPLGLTMQLDQFEAMNSAVSAVLEWVIVHGGTSW